MLIKTKKDNSKNERVRRKKRKRKKAVTIATRSRGGGKKTEKMEKRTVGAWTQKAIRADKD